MSVASIEAALRLDIAELQQKLTLANVETDKWKKKLEESGGRGARAIDDVARAYGRMNTAARDSQRILTANTALFMQAEKAAKAATLQRQATGGRGMALGGAAMQVQDIAVMAQSGAKWTTIIAQQGSQMLSMFGAGGAIMGGLVAVGGAFFSMGSKARESLDATITGAKGLRAEIDALAQGGSIDAVASKLATIGTNSAAAFKELNSFNSFKGGLWTEIMALFGGPTGNEKFAGNMGSIMANAEARQRLQQRMLELSAQEVQLAELKAAGDEEALAKLQREIALTQELARIQSLNLPQPTKDQLAADATYRSELAGTKPFDQVKAAAEIAAINARMDAQRIAALPAHERYFELADQQQKVFARMDTEGGAFFEKSIAGVKEWIAWLEKAGRTKELLNVTKLLEEVLDLQKQMDEANAAAKAGAAQEQDAIDRDLAAREKARIDEFIATSQAPATMAQVAQGQSANALPITQRPHSAIYHTGRKIGMGGGLNQFYRDQQTASQWDMLQRSPSQWQQLQNGGSAFWATQRGGSHLDAGLAGNQRVSTLAATASHLSSGLAARRAVDRQSATPSDPTAILTELLKVTQKGLLGE